MKKNSKRKAESSTATADNATKAKKNKNEGDDDDDGKKKPKESSGGLKIKNDDVKKEKSQPSGSKNMNSTITTSEKNSEHDNDVGGGGSNQQKRALKQERQSQRRHADAVAQAKAIWNKLRFKNNNSKDEIKIMVHELMTLIQGKIHEISLQHDASRVVQAALQFGNAQQRMQVVTELCVNSNNTTNNSNQTVVLVDLCRVQYSHFVVLKMIKYCARDDSCMRLIVKSFKGEIPKLAVHAVGSKVVDALFRTFPPKITAPLKQEFYGPHLALFAVTDVVAATSPSSNSNNSNNNDRQPSIPTLESNLKIAPDKKEPSLEFVLSILNKCIEKNLFGFSYFQELFAEYVAVASPIAIRTLVANVADHSIHIMSTRAGTRGVVSCISYGTAKDRKRIMKGLKGLVRSSLLHRDAYLAIMRLVQVTDDTVSTFKSILSELLVLPEGENKEDNVASPLLEIATHETASRLLLLILVADTDTLRKYLDPYERSLLLGEMPTVEEKGEQVPTSKKNPETRRSELLQHLREPLIELTSKHSSELLRSLPGARVLREVYDCFHPKALVDAVVATCEAELTKQTTTNKDGQTDALSLFEDPVGHHSIKNLFAVDADQSQTSIPSGGCFSTAFFDKLGDRLAEIGSTNRGAFVVTAMTKVPTIAPEVLRKLKKEKKIWQNYAEGTGATAGFQALLKEISPEKST